MRIRREEFVEEGNIIFQSDNHLGAHSFLGKGTKRREPFLRIRFGSRWSEGELTAWLGGQASVSHLTESNAPTSDKIFRSTYL